MHFRPLTDFPATVAGKKNTYIKGFVYTVRPGDDDLALLVPIWVKDKKVEVLNERTSPRASGKLTTKEK